MKNTNLKVALVGVVLCGVLAACKPAEVAPVAEAPAPAPVAEPVPEPAPVVPAADPAATDPAAVAAPATEMPAADDAAADEDSPHSGGDKVSPAKSN